MVEIIIKEVFAIKQKFLNKMLSLPGEHCFFLITTWFCNFLPVAWPLLTLKQYRATFFTGALYLASACVLTILIEFFPHCLGQKILRFSLGSFFAFVCLLECFSLYTYQARIGTGIITAILETNSQEMHEFIHMYINSSIFYIIGGVGSILLLFYLVARTKYVRQFHFSPFIFTLFLSLGLGSSSILANAFSPYWNNGFCTPPLISLAYSCQQAFDNIRSYNDLKNKLNRSAIITENHSTIPNIVFILGEATSRHYLELYGYYLPNTPRLKKLAQEKQLAVFTDCISPHSTTVAVLRTLFTFNDYESKTPWYDSPNLFTILNKAGYKTYWLSNQESSGIWGNVAALY